MWIHGGPPVPITLAEIVPRLNDRPPVPMPDVTRLVASLVGDVSGTIRRTIRAMAPTSATDFLEAWFPWTRDQRLAMDRSVAEDERMAAVGPRAHVGESREVPSWPWGTTSSKGGLAVGEDVDTGALGIGEGAGMWTRGMGSTATCANEGACFGGVDPCANPRRRSLRSFSDHR